MYVNENDQRSFALYCSHTERQMVQGIALRNVSVLKTGCQPDLVYSIFNQTFTDVF